MGDGCANTLRNLILLKTKDDEIKREEIIKYCSLYLTELEANKFKKTNDFKWLISVTLKKFVKIDKLKESKFRFFDEDIDYNFIDVKEMEDLIYKDFRKINYYLELNPIVAFNKSKDVIKSILNFIINYENLEGIKESDYYEVLVEYKIIPKHIESAIESIENYIHTIKNDSNNRVSEDLVESTFLNNKIIIKWFYIEYLNLPVNKIEKISRKKSRNISIDNEFRAIAYKDLENFNFSIEELADKLISMDLEMIDDIDEDHEGSPSFWIPFLVNNPETWKIILDKNNEIVAYWHFIPLFEDNFNLALEGKLIDTDFKIDMVPVMILGVYDIYFVTIVLKDLHSRSTIFKLLLDSLAKSLEDLATNGVYIEKICTLAYTPDGESLSKSIGLKYTVDSEYHGKIYSGSIFDLLGRRFCNEYKVLKTLYKELKNNP
jgi:hypothetical protein